MLLLQKDWLKNSIAVIGAFIRVIYWRSIQDIFHAYLESWVKDEQEANLMLSTRLFFCGIWFVVLFLWNVASLSIVRAIDIHIACQLIVMAIKSTVEL